MEERYLARFIPWKSRFESGPRNSMTFPEFIQRRATWLHRLVCRVFGHRPFKKAKAWHPSDNRLVELQAKDLAYKFCVRCGEPLGVNP